MAFDPSIVQPFDTLDVPEHLTAVIHLPKAIQEQLRTFAQSLLEKEPSLLVVKPENYHITLAAAPIDTPVNQFKELAQQALRAQPIEVNLAGVVLDASVVAIPAFPESNALYEARKQIADALGEPLPEGPRSELGWISLARFSKPPARAMADLALHEIHREWGKLPLASVSIYRTNNKHLEGAVRIATA